MQIWTKQLASGLPIVLWKEHHSKNTSAFVQPGCLVWLVTTGSQYSKPTTQSKKMSPLMKVAQKKKENHVLATPFLHFSNHQLIHFVHGLRGAVSVVKLEQQVLNTKMQETSGIIAKCHSAAPKKTPLKWWQKVPTEIVKNWGKDFPSSGFQFVDHL